MVFNIVEAIVKTISVTYFLETLLFVYGKVIDCYVLMLYNITFLTAIVRPNRLFGDLFFCMFLCMRLYYLK